MTDPIFDHRALTLLHLVEQAGLAYVEIDTRFRITFWNNGARALFGRSDGEVMGRPLETVLEMAKETQEQIATEEGACLATLGSGERQIPCRIRFTPIVDASGVPIGTSLLIRDVMEIREQEARLNARGQSMADILGFAPIGIFHVGLDGRLMMSNSEFAWMLGYESSDQTVQQVTDFAGQVFYDAPKAEEFLFILMEAERITRFRCRLRRRDGRRLWALCYAMITKDKAGRMDGFNGYAIDIGDTIRAEAALQKANNELTRLSMRDGLTGISNRRRFDTYLNEAWQRHKKNRTPVSVILCDIDYFKKFNDSYGHQLGDECLKKVAGVIDGCVKEAGGLAARYGGEEFGAVLNETGKEKAVAVAENIRKKILLQAIPHKASEVNDCVTLSLGTSSVVPGEKSSGTVVLAAADNALYEAKNRGRNRVWASSDDPED